MDFFNDLGGGGALIRTIKGTCQKGKWEFIRKKDTYHKGEGALYLTQEKDTNKTKIIIVKEGALIIGNKGYSGGTLGALCALLSSLSPGTATSGEGER